jgi:hypothetical protein
MTHTVEYKIMYLYEKGCFQLLNPRSHEPYVKVHLLSKGLT